MPRRACRGLANVVSADPAVAAENAIDFGGGAASATFGPNAMVRIDGRLVYVDDCPDDGFDDFVHPASDV